MKQAFSPFDLGFMTRDATVEAALLTQARLKEAQATGKQLVLIKIDLEKAYDRVQRASMCQLLLKVDPKLVRHFLVNYLPTSHIKYPNMPTTSVTEGVTTGDVLSPLYSNLVFAHVCQKSRDEFPGAWVLCYFDDEQVVAEGEVAFHVFDKLVVDFVAVGLKLNRGKCEVLFAIPPSEELRAMAEARGLPVVQGGRGGDSGVRSRRAQTRIWLSISW